jgi:hypothetical protein
MGTKISGDVARTVQEAFDAWKVRQSRNDGRFCNVSYKRHKALLFFFFCVVYSCRIIPCKDRL